jgi:hypothetical protein
LPDRLLILPDGQITQKSVQPLAQKYSASPVGQIKTISPAVLSHSEGRLATSQDAGRDAVDAAARETGDAKADGEVVWS